MPHVTPYQLRNQTLPGMQFPLCDNSKVMKSAVSFPDYKSEGNDILPLIV